MDCLLQVKLVPGAARAGVVGFDEAGVLKLKVSKPPVEGQANRACLELLSDVLDLPKSRLELVRGHTSRVKTFRLIDCPPALEQKIKAREL